MAACLSCTSARVLHFGVRAGSLWCFVKRYPVNPDSVCQSFTATTDAGRDHVLVKSDPKAHFDPFTHQEIRHEGC